MAVMKLRQKATTKKLFGKHTWMHMEDDDNEEDNEATRMMKMNSSCRFLWLPVGHTGGGVDFFFAMAIIPRLRSATGYFGDVGDGGDDC